MKKWIVSSSPHIRSKQTTSSVMRDVLIALLPAAGASIWVFGIKAFYLMGLCVFFCIGFEYISQTLLKRTVTIKDLSAAVTGLLIAFNLPINAPWWLCLIGCFFAIVIVKQLFGGIGHNFMNPALAARVLLVASWPTRMTGGAFLPVDAATSATPLAIVKEGLTEALPSYSQLFLGGPGVYGCIGEISALALIIGGIYLLLRRVISPVIPVVYIGTVGVFALIAGQDVLFQLFSGGLMLGAIFMATDYVTTPTSFSGQCIFALGCGLITCIIRFYGGYPEGVSYSILLMNVLTPLIEKFTRPKKYGEVKNRA